MAEGVATLTEDGTLLYCNRRFAQILDAPVQDLLGGSLLDHVPAADKSTLPELLSQAARREEGGMHVDLSLRSAGGQEQPVHLSLTPFADGPRRVLCLVATDLSPGRQGIDELIASMVDGVLVHDAGQTIVRANAAAVRMAGFELAGMTPRELERRLQLRWPDGRPLAKEEYPSSRAMRGRIAAGVHLVLARDGEPLDMSVTCAPLRSGAAITGAVSVWHDVTAFERGKQALRESKALFQSVLENSLDAAYRRDLLADRFDYLSPVIQSILGYSAEELRAMTLEEGTSLIHPEDRPALDLALREAAVTGKLRAEYRCRAKDGSYCWLMDRAVLVRDEGGSLRYRSGIVRDISDRKREQDQLRHQAHLLDNIGEAVISTDEAFHIKTLNKAAQVLYGYSESEALGRNANQLLGVEYPALGEDALKRELEQSGIVRVDVVQHNRRGERLHVQSCVVALREPAGRMIGTLGIFRDITGYARLQQALRESERHYRTLFEACPLGIIVVDPAGRIVEFNEVAYQQLGYRREEFSRLSVSNIDVDESPAEVLQHIERILALGSAVFEAKHRTKTGESRSVVVNARVIEVGGRKRLLSVTRDITERRRVEQELKRSAEALRELDRNKNDFISVLSHELRGPLAPILSSLFLLEQGGGLSERGRRAAAVIGRQVRHLTRLIDDLLDVTRISRGKIRLEVTRLDLREVVRRTLEDLATVLAEHRVSVDLPAQEVPVRGDPTRLSQILGNLLTNAVKFTPPGGRITVSVAEVGRWASLTVIDSGAGIEPAMIRGLFTPFVQLAPTLDRTRGGLGLGLALVKGFVELHGGTVQVFSEGRDQGTRFEVRFPLERAERSTDAPPVGRAPPERRRRRVLIIEDNRDTAQGLREVLELEGHRVATAGTGSEGLEHARQFEPEIVLCDIGLPEMNGYEVARALRRDPKTGSAFLVALTGFAQPEDFAREQSAGFDAHFSKPPDLAALQLLVEQAPAR